MECAKMKILVFGCNGMAGHTISLYLHEKGHDVTGFAQEASQLVPSIVGDARDKETIRTIVSGGNYDAVINCIGILNQFAEQNKELAVYLNAYLPHFLAEITKDMQTQIVHMSTDCVFSGEKGGYTEDSFRDGNTFYDRTKALGELEDNKNITLRNSIIGPDINSKGIGLLNWFMQQDGPLNGYTKAIWTGQTTLQLAKTMEVAIRNKATGLVNAVPNSTISKYELLKLMNRFLRNGNISISPNDGISADKSLVRTRFSLSYSIPDYETMIAELSIWMREHKHLYPHYKYE